MLDCMIRFLCILLAVGAAFLPAGNARADGFLDAWHPHQSYWSVGWEVGIPVNGLRAGWVNRTSPAGGQLEVRVGLMERLSVGIAGNYNWFDQNFSTATGSVYRRFSAFALRGTAHYYLTSTALQPFVGVGVGCIWTATRRQTADLTQDASSSYLAVDPEVGFLLSTSDSFAFYVLGRYQWTAATFYEVKDAQWIGVQIGMGWFF
jgi:hypothetical protein